MEALPEPMTPAECDLRGMPFMPLDTVRLCDSDLMALATGDEFKAAVGLWCKAWQQIPAGSLPDDDRVLAHLSGAGAKWKKVKAMALRGFVRCLDGRLYHPVIAEKACRAWAHRQTQKGNIAKRWNKEKHQPGNTTVDTVEHTAVDTAVIQVKGRVKEKEEVKKEAQQPSSLPAARPEPAPPAGQAALRKEEIYQARQRVEQVLNSPTCLNLNRIDAWIEAGADLEKDIIPTLNRLKSKWSGTTLRYFDNAVLQARDERITPPEPSQQRAQNPSEQAPPRDPDAQWRGRLGVLAAGGVWPRDIWGPAPGEPGCNVPSHLLEAAA